MLFLACQSIRFFTHMIFQSFQLQGIHTETLVLRCETSKGNILVIWLIVNIYPHWYNCKIIRSWNSSRVKWIHFRQICGLERIQFYKLISSSLEARETGARRNNEFPTFWNALTVVRTSHPGTRAILRWAGQRVMADLLWESGLSLGGHLPTDVVPPGRREMGIKRLSTSLTCLIYCLSFHIDLNVSTRGLEAGPCCAGFIFECFFPPFAYLDFLIFLQELTR